MDNIKTTKASTHYIFWAVIIALFVSAIFLLKSVLLPFVVGSSVAYLLNPTVQKFEKLGIPRGPASIIILSGFLLVLLTFFAITVPVLTKEIGAFALDVPDYINQLKELLSPLTGFLEQYTSHVENGDIQGFFVDSSKSVTTIIGILASKLAAGGQTLVDIISLFCFMPIVAYFMMKEWPSITQWIYDLVPRYAQGDVMELLKQINTKLSGFIRGQISVALILALAYALALTLAGLKYGMLIGLSAGLLSIIPMVGLVIGLIVSVAVAWFQSGEWEYVLIIAGIFLGGQLIEGNFLTPKLVGKSVGLHPLWVFFVLLAGGSLLGILGMFLAVPVAAVIGVLLSFALRKYKQSTYYKVSSGNDDKDDKSSHMKKRNKSKNKQST